MARRKPYTAIGIGRIKCAVLSCDSPAEYQWQICADGRQFRGICAKHDVAINRAVMRLVFGRTREADLQGYADRVFNGDHPR